MLDCGQAAATVFTTFASMAWTAIYSNSDSAAAAVLPLLLGAGLLKAGAPPGWEPRLGVIDRFSRDALQALKKGYAICSWLVTLSIGVAVCVSLNNTVKGVEVEVQLAAPDSDVIGAGLCGTVTCVLPDLRLLKGSGALIQMYSCNATDPEQPVEDIIADSCEISDLLGGIYLEAEFDDQRNIHNLMVQAARIEPEIDLSVDQFANLEFEEVLRLELTSLLSWDDTSCPDGFSFLYAKEGVLTFDVWGLRCNSYIMVGFVLAGAMEVERRAASQGVRCGSYHNTDVDHVMGHRGVEGYWALTADSIRAIDNELALLFVGKGLGGLENVQQALGVFDSADDDEQTILNYLLEIRYNNAENETILDGTERSCFVGGGGESMTIEEVSKQPSVMAITDSTTDGLQEFFSFGTFTFVTETSTFADGVTVAEPRDSAAPVLAEISRVVLCLCCLLFLAFLYHVTMAVHRRMRFLPEEIHMFEQFAALMTVSAELSIISGSGGAAAPACAALVLTFLHGCSVVLYVWVSRPGHDELLSTFEGH